MHSNSSSLRFSVPQDFFEAVFFKSFAVNVAGIQAEISAAVQKEKPVSIVICFIHANMFCVLFLEAILLDQRIVDEGEKRKEAVARPG